MVSARAHRKIQEERRKVQRIWHLPNMPGGLWRVSSRSRSNGRIKHTDLLPGRLVRFNKLEMPGVLLVGIVIGQRTEDDVQSDVEFAVVDGSGQFVAQNSRTE